MYVLQETYQKHSEQHEQEIAEQSVAKNCKYVGLASLRVLNNLQMSSKDPAN
jgi:hypothetical protein